MWEFINMRWFMKALRYDDTKLHLVLDAPRPIPGDGDVLVRVLLAGICSTDLEITKGYLNFSGILGHEFVGRVVEGETVPAHLRGARVVGEINCGCGQCEFCLRDLARHCPSRTVLGISGRDGCFAEYLTIPARNLRPVPDNVRDEDAVFSEPLAAALEILEQVQIQPGQRVLILGDGKLGILAALVMSGTGAEVTLAGRHPEKLAVASELGVRSVASADLTACGFDVVVEAAGDARGRAAAINLVRPRGIVVVKSTLAQSEDCDWTSIVVNELTVVGSRCGLLEPALRELERGIPVGALVSAVYPLDDAPAAFEHARKPEALKVLLDMR
jgi:threonine dehydrogenase-like Zn-dependent dehydrogenase